MSFPQKNRTLNNNNRYWTSLVVHMKNVLVTIVSAKTKYYEKLIISQQIISVRRTFIMLIIALIKISIRIRPNTN